jgi:hypothetical protein
MIAIFEFINLGYQIRGQRPSTMPGGLTRSVDKNINRYKDDVDKKDSRRRLSVGGAPESTREREHDYHPRGVPHPYLGRSVFFTNQGATLKLPVPGGYLAVAMKFEGGRRSARVTGESPLPGRSNYLIGNPTNWHTGIPQFARVRYVQVYPGVDFVFYGTGRDLEYDIALAPGTDVNHVRLTFEGVDSLGVDANGRPGCPHEGWGPSTTSACRIPKG